MKSVSDIVVHWMKKQQDLQKEMKQPHRIPSVDSVSIVRQFKDGKKPDDGFRVICIKHVRSHLYLQTLRPIWNVLCSALVVLQWPVHQWKRGSSWALARRDNWRVWLLLEMDTGPVLLKHDTSASPKTTIQTIKSFVIHEVCVAVGFCA